MRVLAIPVFTPTRPLVVALLAVLLLAGACSSDGDSGGPTGPRAEGTSPEETTSQPPSLETTEGTTTPRGTRGLASSPQPEAVLRLEGDPSTRFSGVCNVGGAERVLAGERLPKRFTFDLDGAGLSCRIQKQDSGDGSLRVILLANNTTRSVQQTNAPNGTIEISHQNN